MAPAVIDTQAFDMQSLTPHDFVKRDVQQVNKYDPGHGIRPPGSFNNKGYLGLFALLGAAMAVATIWFFFWAKNGGFIWRKTDWDDYKSTVLRRKGKDGKTLSNATPTTKLGEKSIAGTWDIEKDPRDMADQTDFGDNYSNYSGGKKKKRPNGKGERQPSDDDLRAYRKERPARVGGMNRQEDGTEFDPSNASRSDLASESSRRPLTKKKPEPIKEETPKKKGFLEKKRQKKAEKAEKAGKEQSKKKEKEDKQRQKESPVMPSGPRPVFVPGNASTVSDASERYAYDNEAYFAAYRPPAPPHAPSRRHEQRYTQRPSGSSSRQASPTKVRPAHMDTYSEAGSSETGTKVYNHQIPGLSRASRDVGFRRGNYGPRRDSLDDSDDNDDMAGFRRR